MTRKVIFRFEGANPRSKAMFHINLTGFFFTLLRLHVDVTIPLAWRRCQTGLWFAFCVLSLISGWKSKCEEKEEEKNYYFLSRKIYECKGNIRTRYSVWVTFLDEQGYHLTLSFYFREPVKFRKEKIVSTS